MKNLTRKEALTSLIVLPALASVATSAAFAADDSNGTKAQYKYQTKPKDGNQCSGCALFVAPGSCRVVKGKISPKGWCTLWAKKS